MPSPAKKHDDSPAELTPFQRECALLAGRASLEADQERDFNENVVMDILNAPSEEEMWNADDKGALGGRDLAGVQFVVLDLEFQLSNSTEIKSPFVDPETGKHIYVWVNAVRYDNPQYSGKRTEIKAGDKFRFNTSAPRIIGKLLYLERENRLEQPVVIEETKLEVGAVLKLRPVNPGTLLQAAESPF